MIIPLLLAQTADEKGILIGSGVIGGGIVWIVRRQLKRVIEHVDDPTIHVPAGTKIVGRDKCDERVASIKDDIAEIKNNLSTVHRRLDESANTQVDHTTKILAAISNIKK